ncbi:MAG TPA: YraN family protein [Gammaproteobacteria bacterium]|nr:YraN family protein [Gammaproteobacteria bacterium]
MTQGKTTRRIGRETEALACAYLQARGLRLLERNYSTAAGEIDLIMTDRHCLVFVEVRYRRSDRFGSGAETVTAGKQRKLLATAAGYLQRHPERAGSAARFDVVSIGGQGQRHTINWIRDAFQACP